MRLKLALILLVIVLTPLALLAWLGFRVARIEKEAVQHRFHQLLLGKLRETRSVISDHLMQKEREHLKILRAVPIETTALRDLVRSRPLVRQIFVAQDDGIRIHPPLEGPLTASEKEFLRRTSEVWKKGALAELSGPPGETTKSEDGSLFNRSSHHGWYSWYWDSGLHLIFWWRSPAKQIIGFEVDRVRILADIIGALPDTDLFEPSLPDGRIALTDSTKGTLYQWGSYQPGKSEAPRVSLGLDSPLKAWNLSFYTSGAGFSEDIGRGAFLNLLFVLVAVGIALGGLATYFWREHSREMREAEQRVNFVNQVSHELKTPLTNIRLYAELLEDSLPEDDPRGERYIEVILSESQRLSRLIGNILSFGRKQKEKVRVQKSPGSVDVSIRSMLDLFCPSLDEKGIRVTTAYGADAEVRFDPDVLQQILGNLISNVEKYATEGKLMEVTSNQEADRTTITVSDRGPGIPLRQREKIFQPFYRLSNRTSDGVAGTGIGLSIAKDLAQIHGGDLVLLRTLQGASFQLTLHTPGKNRNDSADS